MIIDRVAPSLRPDLPLAGYQRWRSLLFLHWHARPQDLRRVVPPQLELDDFEGNYFIGIVPFAMEGVRAKWWPESLAMKFLETNVRTYVRYRGRPGVYFLSLDAESRLAVTGARVRWGLPYYYSRMRQSTSNAFTTYEVERLRPAARLRVIYETGEEILSSQPGSLEHFLLERYLLFVQRRGRLLEGQVHHTPYPAQQAIVHEISESLLAACGLPATDDMPATCHYSRGVDVEIFGLRTMIETRAR